MLIYILYSYCIPRLSQCGVDAVKRGGWRQCIKTSWNYIVDNGKSWKNRGIVVLNVCGNPDALTLVN